MWSYRRVHHGDSFVAAMSDGDNVDVISRLLEARAVIDFRRTSPLHLASEKGLAGAVALLLAAAADADRPDWQASPALAPGGSERPQPGAPASP